MATTSRPTVTCPVCSEYEGPVPSVEAHISSSQGEHEGTVGRDHREELEARAEGREEQRDRLDELDDTETEASAGGVVEGPKPTPTSDVSTSAGVAAAGAPAGLAMISDVDTRYLLVGGIAVVVVVYLLAAEGSSDGGQPAESPEDEEEFDPFASEVGG